MKYIHIHRAPPLPPGLSEHSHQVQSLHKWNETTSNDTQSLFTIERTIILQNLRPHPGQKISMTQNPDANTKMCLSHNKAVKC